MGRKINFFLIKFVGMNSILINFTAKRDRKSGQSKEEHTQLPDSNLAPKISFSLV